MIPSNQFQPYLLGLGSLLLLAAMSAGPLLLSETKVNDWLDELNHNFLKRNSVLSTEMVYMQIDKPIYKPGESIWFSLFVRESERLRPSKNSELARVELIDPKGNIVAKHRIVLKNGRAQSALDLDGSRAGGLYKIKAYTLWQQNEPEALLYEKEILVQSVVLPNLKMKLDFERENFGPGEKVVASLSVRDQADKAVINTALEYVCSLEGKEYKRGTAKTDAFGKLVLGFELPKDLETTDGLLNILIEHQGSTESISRSIPINLGQLEIAFFPEGGDMVEGQPARVAFKAWNEHGEPVDVTGSILGRNGEQIGSFSSIHDGMGSFELASAQDAMKVRIDEPRGNSNRYPLPEPIENGYLIKTEKGTFGAIRLKVYSPKDEALSISGQIRDRLVHRQELTAKPGWNEYIIKTGSLPQGVMQLTLFDSKRIERAERLLFVGYDRGLKVQISTDKLKYLPGELVQMDLKVSDNSGIPMPGSFSVSVVDDALLSFADDKSGKIRSRLLLEPELDAELHEAGFYFDEKEEKAEVALDHLLMTHGWRRFDWAFVQDNEAVVQLQAEKAILKGTVMDRWQRQGIPLAKIKLKGTDIISTTDKNGHFQLPFFDLSEFNTLQISAKGVTDQEFTIADYSENAVYYINANDGPVMFRNRMEKGGIDEGLFPQAAGGFEEAEMMDDAAMNDEADLARVEQNLEGDLPIPPPPPVEEVEAAAEDKNIKFEAVMIMADEDIRGKREMGIVPPEPQAPEYSLIRSREFASIPAREAASNLRSDHRTTVYWNGLVEVGRSGKASFSFRLNDKITSFRATLEGLAEDGSIGTAEAVFYSQAPVSISAKTPAVLLTGDRIDWPLQVVNNTSDPVKAKLKVSHTDGLKALGLPTEVQLDPMEAKTIRLPFEVVSASDSAWLKIELSGSEIEDALALSFKIEPKGFPMTASISGQDLKASYELNISDPLSGSLKAQLMAYPNLMSELLSGIEDILREPYGCFEQTSSSTYPNIMVLDYLRATGQDEPVLEARATDLLEKGYAKLISFETQSRGYEWFGKAPGHEALTAYGLMEFIDMKRVMPSVDNEMIQRTATWLMDRRDGKGGFQRNPAALDAFGRADDDITNAYSVYALSEAGFSDIAKEVDAAFAMAMEKKDPYTLALVANALFNLSDPLRAERLMNVLIPLKQADGSWTGTRHSITRSGGVSLTVETTSLVVLALLKQERKQANLLQASASFLVGSRSGHGGFGSTQATVLALKALTEFAKYAKQTEDSGTIQLFANGKKVGERSYEKGQRGTIVLQDLGQYLGTGKNKLEVRFVGTDKALPFTFTASWYTNDPNPSEEVVLGLSGQLDKKSMKVGETVRLHLELKNKTDEGQPMSMLVVGIPAGLSAQPWQLKELQDRSIIDFFETRGNKLFLYYRQMEPSQNKVVDLDLKAEFPGTFEAAASSAYLYYTAEYKDWLAANSIHIE